MNTCPKLTCEITDSIEYYLGVYSLQSPEANPFIRKSEVLDPELCVRLSCQVKDDLDYYLGQYSLQNGFIFFAADFNVDLPPGTYVSVPPNPLFISKQGCMTMVTLPVPFGSSPAQIEAIAKEVLKQVAAQKVICDTPAPPGFPDNPPTNPPPGGGGYTTYSNSQQTKSCPAGKSMKQNGSLSGGVTVVSGSIVVPAGMFTSVTSQADANAQAQAYMDEIINDGILVQCGYYNTEQCFTCANGTPSCITAGTYFSTVSQADADAQALAAATTACGGVAQSMVWHLLLASASAGSSESGFADGAVSASTTCSVTILKNQAPHPGPNFAGHYGYGTFVNPCAHPITVTIVYSCTSSESFNTDLGLIQQASTNDGPIGSNTNQNGSVTFVKTLGVGWTLTCYNGFNGSGVVGAGDSKTATCVCSVSAVSSC